MLLPAGQVVALFLNGIPLGTVWGICISFLEGRRTSEILGAGLSCAYVVASGVVKSVGAALLAAGVSEAWMPAACGLLFLPLFLLAVRGLSLLPPPSASDVATRVKREPMSAAERRAFLRRYGPGLAFLVVVDRTIASLGVVATAVFLIYVSDGVAHGGSVAIVFFLRRSRHRPRDHGSRTSQRCGAESSSRTRHRCGTDRRADRPDDVRTCASSSTR